MRFFKYHGLGNDFVLVEDDSELCGPVGVRSVCDRRRGIGADGVLVVTPLGGSARVRMVVYNADGSRARMCGNGLRCVARHVVERWGETASSFDVLTDAGVRRVEPGDRATGAVWWVDTSMGEVRPAPAPGAWRAAVEASVGGGTAVYRVDAGNLHAVVFGWPGSRARAAELAETLRREETAGLNVGFVRGVEGSPPRVELCVHEAGAGWTDACATGAAAAFAALRERARLLGQLVERAEIVQTGGTLDVRAWGETSCSVAGPAVFVFEGDIDVGALLESQGVNS